MSWTYAFKQHTLQKFEPLITEVTRFLGTGFYRNLSYQAIPAVPAVVFVYV